MDGYDIKELAKQKDEEKKKTENKNSKEKEKKTGLSKTDQDSRVT